MNSNCTRDNPDIFHSQKEEKAVREAKLSYIEQQKAEKGKKWAFKGTKDNPDIFHSQKEEKGVRVPKKGFGR